MKQEFTQQEKKDLIEFVIQYEGFNDDIKDLEKNIQVLLKQQETILSKLNETRKREEEFFTKMSESKGLHVSELKKMAQSYVMENVNKVEN